MSRTVELGRAVLSIQSAKVELWLTTLISISQQQESTNLQQLSNSEFMHFLSSGHAWVGRGNGMHIALEITMRGEALESSQLRQLAESIANAPAWKYLDLQLSIPANYDFDQGKVHINIGHSRSNGDVNAKRNHRICADVPAADVSPSASVPTFHFQSVQLFLLVTDIKDRSSPARQKRLKGKGMRLPIDYEVAAASNSELEEDPDILFGAALDPTSDLDSIQNLPASQSPFISVQKPNYVQSSTSPMTKSQSQSSSHVIRPGKRKRSSTVSAIPIFPAEEPVSSDRQPIATLIDAAIRLTVWNNLRGSASGLKIKANTFVQSLTDVAPALWRPGYLTALSERVHLAPTLSLSLSRASLRAKSATLRAKFAALTEPLPHESDDPPYARSLASIDANSASSCIADRLWIHVQKNLLLKPSSALNQTFCLSRIQMSSLDDLEILEDNPGHLESSAAVGSALDDSWGVSESQNDVLFRDESFFSSSCQDEPLLGCVSPANRDLPEAIAEQDDELLFSSSSFGSDPAANTSIEVSSTGLAEIIASPDVVTSSTAKSINELFANQDIVLQQRHDGSSPDEDDLFMLNASKDDTVLGRDAWSIGRQNSDKVTGQSAPESIATDNVVSNS